MTMQEAMEVAFKHQLEVFFDMECGFIRTSGCLAGKETWVYFWNLRQYEKAFIFCVTRSFRYEPQFEDEFKFDGVKWWPKEGSV